MPAAALTVGGLALLVAGCSAAARSTDTDPEQVADSGLAYVPGATWRTAPVGAVGMDASRMRKLSADLAAGRYGAVDAVLVVRFGYLVFADYHGWNADRAHTLQSVTKSVTSLLFGMVREREPAAAALDRPVLDVMTRWAPVAALDDRKRALTLGDLLTMRTGMDFWEQPYDGSPLQQLNESRGDWIRFILDRPMVTEPGSAWAYDSGAPILVCGALREILGEAPDAFARRELFEPIGVTDAPWFRSPYDGLPHCGGGLSLEPADLARVGYLVLRHGRWGDRQVVPRAWIDASTTAVTRGDGLFFSSYGSAYGAFWWLFPLERGGDDDGIVTASGSGGQWLFVVPSLDLVIAVAAADGDGLGLLYDGVLPAILP